MRPLQVRIVPEEEDSRPLVWTIEPTESPVVGASVLLTPSITGHYLRVRGLNIVIKVTKEAYDRLVMQDPKALTY